MRQVVGDYVYDPAHVRFAACPVSKLPKSVHLKAKSNDPSYGLLFRDIKLSELRSILGRNELVDDRILSILDDLAASRQAKFSYCEIPKTAGANDLKFIAWVGCGVFEIARPSTIPALTSICFFRDVPLLKSDYEAKRDAIIPSQVAQTLRERRDLHFRKTFGWKDLHLESALHREEVLDGIRLKEKLLRLAESSSNGKAEDVEEDK
jgi:hypothetical protein